MRRLVILAVLRYNLADEANEFEVVGISQELRLRDEPDSILQIGVNGFDDILNHK